LNYILFTVYLVFFSWVLTKIRFIAKAGIGSKVVMMLFVVKVIAGCINGYISLRLSGTPDSIMYNRYGWEEYQLLFSNPHEYLTNLFRSNYGDHYGTLFCSYRSYWNDLDTNIMIKFVSVCDIFTRGDYYVNVILYNFVIFFGSVALYRALQTVYTGNNRLLVLIVFLMPSLLYFGSAIHKDGFIFSSIGIFVFSLQMMLEQRKATATRILCVLLSLGFIFLIRNFVFFALLPAAFTWLLCRNLKYPPLPVFATVYIIGAILFFNAGLIFKGVNFPQYIVQKQIDFKSLGKSATYIEINELEPTFKSIVLNTPQALNHVFARPYMTDAKLSKSLFPLSLELMFYYFIIVLFLFFKKLDWGKNFSNPLILFTLFFSFTILLIIGFTIPVMGAIVRYRSIYLPFFLLPVAFSVNWERIYSLIKYKK